MDLPGTAGLNQLKKISSVSNGSSTNSNTPTGCISTLHQQSAEYDKLSVLDPSTDIMYIGSLMDGESIQSGTYQPIFLPSDYERKPITYSVSIQGSNGSISKTITPTLSAFRNSMQEIVNTNIVGQQPANFTFELVRARSKKEVEMNIKANLKFSTFFSSLGNYSESNLNSKTYYLLKIYQKFFSADIDIPIDGNLFNKPTDFNGNIAPVYISTIDYGRSAYMLIESSYDSARVYKSLEASFSVWKIGGGGSVNNEHKEVMDDMSIKGTIIGGSSSSAASTIQGMQAFHDYVVSSSNLTPESRGEIIAYKLRNAKNHGVYKTLINGDYYTYDCSTLPPLYLSNGNLVRNDQTTAIYWYMDGKLKHLQFIEQLGLFNYSPAMLKHSNTAQLSQFTFGTPIPWENGILKDIIDDKCYYMEGNVLRHITTWPLFEKYNFNEDAITPVSNLNGYIIEAPIVN
ncbi:thiol-activated cytolysin family protein [Pedobacter sp. MC2016-24]|uniref:thiol-activated cytolysin family protein n=1 Tax=Pedobacter sp. MC2016-24 TaxID=2780090 RepID=UPI00187E7FC0|nr:thiol-activated cytolysin family protein [Pedobacter sp. MC2016-24]MBE9601349.1 thiol-activated cytolysin family protein [Pedobacter sp. MC2016-24]